MLGKPLMLARPVRFVLRVCLIQVARDSAVAAGRQFLPFQRVTELTLYLLALCLEGCQEAFGLIARNVEFGPNLVLRANHHCSEPEPRPTDRKWHPRLGLRLAITGDRPSGGVEHSIQCTPVRSLYNPRLG